MSASSSSSSSSVRHRGESMEFMYVMNNLTLLSTLKEHSIPYTSKDRNSIKLGRKRPINIDIFQRTFYEAFRIVELSRINEKSRQVYRVLDRAIDGLNVAAVSLQKKSKGINREQKKKNHDVSREIKGIYFECRKRYNLLPPLPVVPDPKIPSSSEELTLGKKISLLSERMKDPEGALARMKLQRQLADRISKIGVVLPESVETYEEDLLRKKKSQSKYFNFPFLNSPLYQNLAPQISEAAMIQIVPKYVFKRTMDTSPYITDGSKVLKRSNSNVFEKGPAPKQTELRRAASELIDSRFLDMIRKRRSAVAEERESFKE